MWETTKNWLAYAFAAGLGVTCIWVIWECFVSSDFRRKFFHRMLLSALWSAAASALSYVLKLFSKGKNRERAKVQSNQPEGGRRNNDRSKRGR